jgi:multidrug transporter EmrE-like cation transporter
MELSNWLWSLAAAFVSTVYFFLIKYYANNQEMWILATVVALELLVIFLYYKSLQQTRSGIMYSIINGFSVILGVAIAIGFFNESMSGQDMLGIAIIIVGIILVGKKS